MPPPVLPPAGPGIPQGGYFVVKPGNVGDARDSVTPLPGSGRTYEERPQMVVGHIHGPWRFLAALVVLSVTYFLLPRKVQVPFLLVVVAGAVASNTEAFRRLTR